MHHSRAKAPWGVLLGLVAGTVAASLVTPTPAKARHEYHAKLKPGVARPAGARPLFTHLPANTTDGRERWVITNSEPDPADVEEAFKTPVIEVIDDDEAEIDARDGESCPVTTPAYDKYQEYVGPAPSGIDAPHAWAHGVRGKGVKFADVEGGWNDTHEDLPGDRIEHVHGRSMKDPSWRAHGTAVLGEVVGKDNGKGVTGLAPDVDRVYTSSIQGSAVADAIDAAAEKLGPGDVLLIELQSVGPRGAYIPVEFWDDVYEVIRAATDRGVVVIEAAGNGFEDLDHRAYKQKFDRAFRDSGAIMIGAGAPPRPGFHDREKLDFSNYGSRVDVQGWGRKVATLDYGDLQRCDDTNRDRHYTGEFAGTSSASPIVAGAAILVESYAASLELPPLPPRELRTLLRDTGTPQAGDLRLHIGPRPDLARALAALQPIER